MTYDGVVPTYLTWRARLQLRLNPMGGWRDEQIVRTWGRDEDLRVSCAKKQQVL